MSTAKAGKTRSPKQARGVATRESIVDAALDLFSSKGFHQTNSKEIAARAGVAVGTFYSYFKDKRELFLEVLKRHKDQAMQAMNLELAALPVKGAEPMQIMSGLVRAVLKSHDFSPEFHREALALVLSDPELEAREQEDKERILEGAERFMRGFGERLRVEDLEAAALLVSTVVEEVVHRARFFPLPVQEERLTRELADMLARYLFKDECAPEDNNMPR